MKNSEYYLLFDSVCHCYTTLLLFYSALFSILAYNTYVQFPESYHTDLCVKFEQVKSDNVAEMQKLKWLHIWGKAYNKAGIKSHEKYKLWLYFGGHETVILSS